jgi:hypothetical protein
MMIRRNPMDEKVEFLRSLAIFQNLNDEELIALAQIAREYKFEADAVIAYQRDVAHSLYIVRQGRLFASRLDIRGIVRDTQPYTEKKYFGESWLFKENQHTATVRATDPGRLIIIEGEDFIRLLEVKPDMVAGLEPDKDSDPPRGLSDEAWLELTEQIEAVDVEQEHVIFRTQRSLWVLVGKMFLRLSILTIWLVGYLWLANRIVLLRNPLVYSLFLILPVFGLIISLGLTFLDWYNDYFLLTPRQVLHYEFNLSLANFGRQVQRTPLERIQSVGVARPNLFANLLNIGTIRLTTGALGGTGVVEFDKLPKPDRVRKILDEQLTSAQEEAKKIDVSRTQATIRQAVEGHFQIPSPYEIVEEENAAAGSSPTPPLGRIGAGLATRVQTGKTITYRKSRVFLLLRMKWGFLLLFLLILSGIFIFRAESVNIVWIAIWAGFLLITLFVLLYEFLDWLNDQYQLTDRYVIDIDRIPFGLSSSQTQAELTNIQNVTTDQSGIPAYLFNYGNVIIETAGASADIVFERVTNPRQVQQEIFARREQQIQRRARRGDEQRLREFAMMLDVYQQIQEQEHIPQRTMRPAEVETHRLDQS